MPSKNTTDYRTHSRIKRQITEEEWSRKIIRTEQRHLTSGLRTLYFGKCEGCCAEISINWHRKQKDHCWCRKCARAYGFCLGQPVGNATLWTMRTEIKSVETKTLKTKAGVPYIFRRWRMACRTKSCNNVYDFSCVSVSARQAKKPNFFCRECFHYSKRKRPFEATYNGLKASAKKRKRKIDVKITLDDFISICSISSCFYCKKDLKRYARNRKSGLPPSQLDRLDPNLGYTKENAVPCCAFCNYTKNAYVTSEEMIVIGFIRQLKIDEAIAFLFNFDLDRNSKKLESLKLGIFQNRKRALRDSQKSHGNYSLGSETLELLIPESQAGDLKPDKEAFSVGPRDEP